MTAQQPSTRFDVASIGEALLRLSVPSGNRLSNASALDVETGGAESNVCVALSRLGRRCGWISRLPDSPLGERVVRALRADGVDVSAVRRVSGARMGVYFVEYAGTPRSIDVIYDRADSAMARMTTSDVDWDFLLGTRVLHLTGITAALSDTCYAIVAEAIRRARTAGVRISFDVNYRARLWDAAVAGVKLRPLIAEADLLFCKSADAAALFGCTGEPDELTSKLKALTRAQAVVCTFGAKGAALRLGNNVAVEPALPVRIVDPIGAGDAFAAGVLDGWLDGGAEAAEPALLEGLRRGVALAAIALSQQGDGVLTTRAELNAVMTGRQPAVLR